MAGFFSDPEDYNDEEERGPKGSPFWRIVGKTLKAIFWATIILINALLFWRIFSSGTPAKMKQVDVDNSLRSAYAAYLADESADKPPFAVYQRENKRRNITDEKADKETGFPGNYGYFALADQVIFPSARQVQVTFRYNLSTLSHLSEDYSLGFDPDPDLDWFDVSLRVVLKGSGEEEGETVRIPAVCVLSDRQNRYCYRRLVFRDLPDFDTISAIYVDFYYNDDADYELKPYGSLCIYSEEYEIREYKLDKDALKKLTD